MPPRFIAIEYFTNCEYYFFFLKSISRRVFGLFALLAIVNSTDMHVLVQVPCGHTFSFVKNIYQKIAGCGRQQTNAPTSYCLKDVSVQIL